MIKNKVPLLLVVGIFLLLSGCRSQVSLLEDELNSDEIDSIQVVLPMGNPDYGALSKIIMDRNEIENMVYAFNNAVLGNRVDDEDIWIGDSLRVIFFTGDSVSHQFFFNSMDTERVWKGRAVYMVSYVDQTPFERYQASIATEMIVDENLVEMAD